MIRHTEILEVKVYWAESTVKDQIESVTFWMRRILLPSQMWLLVHYWGHIVNRRHHFLSVHHIVEITFLGCRPRKERVFFLYTDIWSRSRCILRKIILTLTSSTQKLHSNNTPKGDIFRSTGETHYLVTYHKKDREGQQWGGGGVGGHASPLPRLFPTTSPHLRTEGCGRTHRRAVSIVFPAVCAERSHSDCHTPTQGRCRPTRKQPCTHLGTQSHSWRTQIIPNGTGVWHLALRGSQLFSECVILMC